MCRRTWPESTAGKKSRPQREEQAARQQAERHEANGEVAPVREQHRQRERVRAARLLEARVEGAVHALQRARLVAFDGRPVVLSAHQQHHHRRHQRARQQVGRGHREHDGLGHRHEQEARDAGQEEHRHEHDADADGGHEGRHADLAGAHDDGLVQRGAQVQVALDVLDRDDGLVDQHAHRQREAAQRHQVERLAQDLQDDHRGQDGQRDRERDHQRAAPVAQEQQHQCRGEAGGDQGLHRDADDRGLHEDGLVEQRLDRDLPGHLLARPGQQGAQVGHDVQRGRAAVLQHRQQHAALAVLAHDVGLRREAVAHERDVADGRRYAVGGAHRQVA